MALTCNLQPLTCNLRPLGDRVYLHEFITPRTYLIEQLYPTLQRATKEETVHACLDWVCRNIKYKTERGDVWLMPSEAIAKGESDCEDLSFCLCSLLRACGLSADEVFVALGNYGTLVVKHAWVNWLNGKYWVLESTLSQAPDSIPEQVYPYDAWILFNDVNTMELKPGFQLIGLSSRKDREQKIREIEDFYGIKVRR